MCIYNFLMPMGKWLYLLYHMTIIQLIMFEVTPENPEDDYCYCLLIKKLHISNTTATQCISRMT